MPNRPHVVELSAPDRTELERLVRSPGALARDVSRARIILLSAQGMTGPEIAERIGCSEPTVVLWRQRFSREGIAGLRDRSRGPRDSQPKQARSNAASGDPEPGTRQSLKAVQTRQRLIRAARHVFEERGFVDSRVADITSAAGASYGSFYRYFSSRDQIFHAVADEVFEEMYATAPREIRNTEHRSAIAAGHAQYFDFWIENRKILITLDQVAGFDPSVFDRWKELRQSWISFYTDVLDGLKTQGRTPADIDPYHTACALGAMVEHSLRRWIGHGDEHDRDIALRTLNDIWWKAISA